MKDKLGKEILEGSVIVYGHLLGHSAGLRIGRVLKVETKRNESKPYSLWEARDEYRITVIGIYDPQLGEPRLNSRTGTLLHPDRVIVLRRDQVSMEYLELFELYDIDPEGRR